MDVEAGVDCLPSNDIVDEEQEVVFKSLIKNPKDTNGVSDIVGDGNGNILEKEETDESQDEDGTIEYDDKNIDDIQTLECAETPERIPGRRIGRGGKRRTLSQESQPDEEGVAVNSVNAKETKEKEEPMELPMVAPSSPALDILRREPRAKMCMSPGKPPGSPTAAVVSSSNTLSPGFSKPGARKSISNNESRSSAADKQMASILKPANPKRENTPQGDTDKENISQEKKEKETDPSAQKDAKEPTGPSPTTARQADIRTMLISQGVKGARARIGGKRSSFKPSPKRAPAARAETKTNSLGGAAEEKPLKQGSKLKNKKTARKSCKGSRGSSGEPKSESPSRISGSNLANLTLRLKEIERTLGIKSEMLSKIDAKTLDKLILEKANLKSRETTPNRDQKSGSKNNAHLKSKLSHAEGLAKDGATEMKDCLDSGDEFPALSLELDSPQRGGPFKVAKAKKGFTGTRTKASLVAKLKPKNKAGGRLKGFALAKRRRLEAAQGIAREPVVENGWKDDSEIVVNSQNSSTVSALLPTATSLEVKAPEMPEDNGSKLMNDVGEAELSQQLSDGFTSEEIKSPGRGVVGPKPRKKRRKKMGTYKLPNARKITPQKAAASRRKTVNSDSNVGISGVTEVPKDSSEISGVSSEVSGVSSEISGVSSEISRTPSEASGVANEISETSSEVSRNSSEISRLLSTPVATTTEGFNDGDVANDNPSDAQSDVGFEPAPEAVDDSHDTPSHFSQESDLDSSMSLATEDEQTLMEEGSASAASAGENEIPEFNVQKVSMTSNYLSSLPMAEKMKIIRSMKKHRRKGRVKTSWSNTKALRAKRAKYHYMKYLANFEEQPSESESVTTDPALHVITARTSEAGAQGGEPAVQEDPLLKVYNDAAQGLLEKGPSLESGDPALDTADNSRRSRRKRKTNDADSETSVSESDVTLSVSGAQEIPANNLQAQSCSCQCFHHNHRHKNHRHKKATKAKRRKLSQSDCNPPLVESCETLNLSPVKLNGATPCGSSNTSPSPPVISPQKPLQKRGPYKKNGAASKTSGSVSGEEEEEEEFPPEIDVRPDIPLSKFVNTPNGITYPVTPPRTPEQTINNQINAKRLSAIDQGHEFIPLCCCKISGAMCKSVGQVVYCQALDSIDGKVVGCCNKVVHPQLVRPAVKIPFMAVCESHRKRLKSHQCCPGCGHFCTQGKFYQCRKEGSGVHHFHKQCQVYKDNKYYCPHCGEESMQYEANIKLTEPHNLSFFIRDESMIYGPRAKMAYRPFSSKRMSQSLTTEQEVDNDLAVPVTATLKSSGAKLSSSGLPLGPSRTELENALAILDGEKPKTLRAIPKSLYKAARSNELEKLLFMLSEGIDPNHRFEEHNGQTALHAAAATANLSLVHILLQAGAMPDILDKELRTALMLAADTGKVGVMKALVDAGATTHAKGEDGMTALHITAKNGNVDCLKYLLYSCDLDVNLKDDGGWTPIIWASEYGHVETVKFLMSAGADPNIRDNEENTGLHWAAYAGSVDIAELYLNAGCNLEAANEHGDRVLHIASRQDHYECVVLFLARGADSEARNNENESPIGCCADQNSKVWMALRVNRQLKTFAAQRLSRPERLLHRDISMGREANAMPVVNDADDENYPTDFQYVAENVETSPMNINRVITSLQSCRCKDDCGSMFCSCGRNSVRCWYDKEGRLVKEFNMLEPPLLFECNKACKCWVTCQNRVVQLGITCRLQVFRTLGRGWGCRTLLDIQPGTFVCEYIGEYISDAEADSREDDSYLFDLDNKDSDTFCIDARRYGNVSRFVNHLCEPNLIPVKVFCEHQDLRFPRICFFASRVIKAGEELGFDYGEKFWIIKWKQFTCECGSPKCKYNKDVIQQTIADYNRRQQEEEALENA